MTLITNSSIRLGGALLFLVGLAVNQWTLEAFFVPDGSIGNDWLQIGIVVVQITLLITGSWVFLRPARLRMMAPNLVLLFASLALCFGVMEAGYRLLDPFPSPSAAAINHTEFGNLSEYDEILGWKGVPSGRTEFVTINNSVWLEHNQQGFRDIEHDESSRNPAIVFLGDSFAWGYEVEFEDMFVNRLRQMLPSYEVFNLSHRGYGTDQELLTFQRWKGPQTLELVVLMFSENDVGDNNSMRLDLKPKPKYELIDGELTLVGVPVPKVESWTGPLEETTSDDSRWSVLVDVLYSSHAFHDLLFRYMQLGQRIDEAVYGPEVEANNQDLRLTARILEELKTETERRGARLLVAFVPSKLDVEELHSRGPYQDEIAELCEQLDIQYLDLLETFKARWYRTYYRQGMHWNPYGHEVAAEGLYDYLAENFLP